MNKLDLDVGFNTAFMVMRPPQISQLHNVTDFGLDSVSLIQEDDGYRLVVHNFGNELFNRSFAGIIEARKAFLKLYACFPGRRARKIIPHWTDFFGPDCKTDELIIWFID